MSAEGGAARLAALGQDAVSELMGEDPLAAAAVVGIGIDVVDVDRFRHVLDRRAHLADRLFTAGEQVYALDAGDAVPRMSTRFAAKEATMKALGVGLGAFRFADVEVVRSGLDAPALVLHGAALAMARRAGVVRWHLSLSHTHEVAMAIVVAVGDAAAGRAAVPGRDAVPVARP